MSAQERPAETEEDPIDAFLQDVVYHGKSQRTRDAYERALRRFERFVDDGDGADLAAVTHRDCMAWVHSLRGDLAESTVATYASYLHRFYAYMTQVGRFDANPMTLVTEEMDERIDTDPNRRELSVEEMRTFVASLSHPLERAVVVTLLKTGLRVGELCNLDVRDLHLSEPPVELPADPRPTLHGKPDTLYVDAAPARDAEYNGERRTASNKRERSTVVPVDDELATVLGGYLAIRPDAASPAEPLFARTSGNWGRRLSTDGAYGVVTDRAAEMGWHEPGGGPERNVTPHYFRHFFTTHLRDRTGDRGVVKYLRGDVASDVIDTYTHNWGDQVRDVYEANVYSLL